MMKRNSLVLLYIVMTLPLTGCGAGERQVVTINRPSYEKITYQTVEVQRGDLSASVTLELDAEGYEEISYYAGKEELTLDKVYVSVGDKVKKGDVLVSFESEKIRQMIAAYEDEKSQKELLVQHYENLMKIDKDADYETDMKMLREDIGVAQLYIEEATNRLSDYRIVANEDGIITEISEYLQNSVIAPEVKLLSQVAGSGRYLAVSESTEAFAVGEVYPVSTGDIEFELRLTDIAEDVLTFEPVDHVELVSTDETLKLILELPEQKDVVYVNRHAVCTIEGEEEEKDMYCVYEMKENGYQKAVFVTPGERIGDNIIITEGLAGGEKVVIR